MKALSLTQPWATLVAIGAKRYETRGWSTPYRGPVAIHAAKAMPRWALDAYLREPFYNETLVPAGYSSSSRLPRGEVVALAVVSDVLPAHTVVIGANEHSFGDFSRGRYAWRLEHVVQLPVPIPARGALGLWEWTPSDPSLRESLARLEELARGRP